MRLALTQTLGTLAVLSQCGFVSIFVLFDQLSVVSGGQASVEGLDSWQVFVATHGDQSQADGCGRRRDGRREWNWVAKVDRIRVHVCESD